MFLSTIKSDGHINLFSQARIRIGSPIINCLQFNVWLAFLKPSGRSQIWQFKNTLDYVIDLLDDATDFSWASAKASHVELLCRMEQGEIKSWLETEKIDRVCRAHAQRHSSSSSGKVTTCVYYNKGSCAQKQTHETRGVLYKHVCASCWSKDGKFYPHPQTECRKSAKNE